MFLKTIGGDCSLRTLVAEKAAALTEEVTLVELESATLTMVEETEEELAFTAALLEAGTEGSGAATGAGGHTAPDSATGGTAGLVDDDGAGGGVDWAPRRGKIGLPFGEPLGDPVIFLCCGGTWGGRFAGLLPVGFMIVADGIVLLLLLTAVVPAKTFFWPLSHTNDDEEKEELSCFTDTDDLTLVSLTVLVISSSTPWPPEIVCDDITVVGVVYAAVEGAIVAVLGGGAAAVAGDAVGAAVVDTGTVADGAVEVAFD